MKRKSPGTRPPAPRKDRGVVAVLVLLAASVILIAAASFLSLAFSQARGLRYRTAERRAMLSCRSGLEHARGFIDRLQGEEWSETNPSGKVFTPDGAWSMYSDGSKNALDDGGGWAGFFARSGNETSDFHVRAFEEEVVEWLDPFGNDDFGGGPHSFVSSRDTFVLSSLSGRRLGQYAVYVSDMDGRIHCNPASFQPALGPGATALKIIEELTDGLGLTPSQTAALTGASSPPYSSLPELKQVCGLSWAQTRSLAPFLTPYPKGNPASPPPVNINTARRKTIRALLSQIPSLKNASSEIDAVADLLASSRPFGGRTALEKVLYDYFKQEFDAASTQAEKDTAERRFNDVLNSLNDSDPSAYLPPGDASGVYRYDFDTLQPYGGEHSSSANVTWAAAVKFRSRFFRIVVLGRGWTTSPLPPPQLDDWLRDNCARRWLEAVYDASSREIVWERIHLRPDFNVLTP